MDSNSLIEEERKEWLLEIALQQKPEEREDYETIRILREKVTALEERQLQQDAKKSEDHITIRALRNKFRALEELKRGLEAANEKLKKENARLSKNSELSMEHSNYYKIRFRQSMAYYREQHRGIQADHPDLTIPEFQEYNPAASSE